MNKGTKCARCGKGHASISEMQEIEGHFYGPECAVKVRALQTEKGLKGDALQVAARKQYREEMRVKTVEGMIKKGMFPGVKTYAEFAANKEKVAKDKAKAKADKVKAAQKAKEAVAAE